MKKGLFLVFFFLLVFNSTLFSQEKRDITILDAIKASFVHDNNLKRELLKIETAEYNFQIERGEFDYNLISNLGYNKQQSDLFERDPRKQLLNTSLLSNTAVFNLGFQKKMRTGQKFQLGVSYDFSNSNLTLDQFNKDIYPYLGFHSMKTEFSITQPLLKQRGKSVTLLNEKIAFLNIENAKYSNDFTISQKIYKLGIAYWDYFLANEVLKINRQNEVRMTNLLDLVSALVEADKKPASDLTLSRADLLNQEKLTLMAIKQVEYTKTQLLKLVGLAIKDYSYIGTPSSPFPLVTESGYNEKNIHSQFNSFIGLSIENRADFKFNRGVLSILDLKYKKALDDIKPKLDLTGVVFVKEANYGKGLHNIFPSFNEKQGQDFGLGIKLTFELPLRNTFFKGQARINENNQKDQKLLVDALEKETHANIDLIIKELNANVVILNKTEETLLLYKKSYNDEMIKFKNGLTTLMNLVLFQEKLINIELAYLEAKKNFSISLLDLRFQTGTLVDSSTGEFSVNQEVFYTFPKINNF